MKIDGRRFVRFFVGFHWVSDICVNDLLRYAVTVHRSGDSPTNIHILKLMCRADNKYRSLKVLARDHFHSIGDHVKSTTIGCTRGVATQTLFLRWDVECNPNWEWSMFDGL